MTFKELALKEDLQRAIDEMGFVEPTEIQEQAIPQLIAGEIDFIGLAQTGTGKTAAFGLPLLETIDASVRVPQALIVCPTRELCLQITKELQRFAKYQKGMNVGAVYGGTSINDQLYNLRRGVHIVVGTPGRLMDHIERGSLDLTHIKTVVLDEADEMLNMGFQEDIDTILGKTPAEKNTWLFSATMSGEIERITKKYMETPVRITVGSRNSSSKTIEHQYCVVKYENAYHALRRFVDFYPDLYGMLFCKTKKETAEIAEKLSKDGYAVDTIHGDLSQFQRDSVMKKFREKSIKLLIATDVAARGIDVSDITHVFHYNLPQDIENYTHRSGRTGRAGKTGMSIAILNTREARQVPYIERTMGSKMTYIQVPSGFEVCEKQLYNFIHTVHTVEVKKEAIAPYLSRIEKEFQDLTKEALLEKLVSLEFNTFLHAYENAPNLNASMHGKPLDGKGYSGKFGAAPDNKPDSFAQFKINVGKQDGVEVGQLINFVCRNGGIRGQVLGKIQIMPTETYIGIAPDLVGKIARKLTGLEFKNTPISASVVTDAPLEAPSFGYGPRKHTPYKGKRKKY